MASAPLEFLTGKVVSLIESEVSLFGRATDELEEIKRELKTMKAFFADVERKGDLSEVEKTWVEDAREVSIEVEDIIEEYNYQINKQRSWGPYKKAFRRTISFPKNYLEKRRMATKLQKIIGRIKAIPESKKRYDFEHKEGSTNSHSYDPNRVKIYAQSSRFLKDDDLVGMKDAKEELLGYLLSGPTQRSVISVVGMGGSGKTTLVANNFNNPTVKQQFNCYAFVTVSQTYHIEDLLRMMIKQLFAETNKDILLDMSNMSYNDMVPILDNYLQPKRYVVVLDDVWDINLWNDINKALPDGGTGSRVMLTTRNESIASYSFGVRSYVHCVQPLSNNEAWDLFSRKAFSSWPDSSCPSEFEGIVWDLVRKCNGLPLGIAALGGLMSTKKFEYEWKNIYSSLNWELSNNPTLEPVKSILLLSYNDLSYQLKQCFLYFSIFPEDYEISCERLIRLWMGEGFVEKVLGEKAEDKAENYIAQLTCRCMLQVVERESSGRPETLKLHDLLHELAISISKVERFCTTYSKQEEIHEVSRVARRLSIQANHGELRTHIDMSKVRTFFIFPPKMANNSHSVEKIPSDFKQLRVLDIEDVPIVQLPNEMWKFFNMKYLNLRGTKVKELPEGIGNLHNLETLDIYKSKIKVLPNACVKLKSLRYLLMGLSNIRDYILFHYVNGTQAPFDISKLKSLLVLDGIEVDEKGMVMKQLRHMTQLTRLGITNVREAHAEDLCKAIGGMTHIKDLRVKTSNEDEVLRLDSLPSAPPPLNELYLYGKLEKVPHWFGSLQNLTFLYLAWSRLVEDFLPHIQALPNLTRLYLRNAHVGNQLVFDTGFRKLTVLEITNFPQLNMINIEKGVMPALQTLRIANCKELKELPQGIEHLTCLQKLILVSVSNELVEQMCAEESLSNSQVKHIPEVIWHTNAEFENWRRAEPGIPHFPKYSSHFPANA